MTSIKVLVSFPLEEKEMMFERGLFSEARWEYNFLEAVLADNRFDKVFTNKKIWPGILPAKLQDDFNPNLKVPYLMQGFQPEFFSSEPSMFLIGVYSPNHIEEKSFVDRIRYLDSKGIPTIICNLWDYESHPGNEGLKRQNLFLPYIKEKVDIERPRSVMFWNQKSIFHENSHNWLLMSDQLKKDYPEYKYLAYTSTTHQLLPVFEVLPILNRKEVNDTYLKTKLILSPNFQGGGPIEATGFGVPFASYKHAPKNLERFKGLKVLHDFKDIYLFFKDLMTNKELYKETAISYQDYGYSTYSYQQFCDKLLSIIS
jgi:hypothetical protein